MFVSVENMVKAEQRTIRQLLVPGKELMFRAGSSVADFILKEYPKAKSIIIAGGYGNNAGDGFVTALKLADHHRDVRIATLTSKYQGDAKIFFDKCQKEPKIDLVEFSKPYTFGKADLMVDALLGTGFRGPPKSPISNVIYNWPKTIPTVSVDCPSGIDCNTGFVWNKCCVKADHTITFAAAKLGLKSSPYVGEMHVVDIGILPICFDDEKWWKLTHQNN